MSAMKKGTKLTENPKDTMIRVRMDNSTIEQLDECVEILNSNRSEVIRKGVEELNSTLKKVKK